MAYSTRLLGIAGLALAAQFCQTVGAEEDVASTDVRRPLVAIVGAGTRLDAPECQRIVDRSTWREFWQRHVGRKNRGKLRPSRYLPLVDFEHCLVIAIAGGPDASAAGVRFEALQETPEEITFDYSFAPAATDDGEAKRGRPFGYFVLPRSSKAIVVRELIPGSGANRGSSYRPKARFAAFSGEKQVPAAINVVFGLDPGKGSYDGVVGKPHDTWNLLDVGQTRIENLLNRSATKTAVKLQVSENDGEWGITDHTGVYHAYIYHNCRCVDLEATFSGLAPGRYKIYVYAHGDAPNQNAAVELAVGPEVYGSKQTLNDGSWDFRSKKLAEGVQYVSFEFTATEGEPVRITSRRAGSDYSMFNAIQIVPLGGSR